MEKFIQILIRKGVISKDQLADAQALANKQDLSISEALVRLGYCTGEQVIRATAQAHNLDYVNLEEISISPTVVELVPESVARENIILPLEEVGDDALRVIVSDPLDLETFDKLRFILNKDIKVVMGSRASIQDAINRHYGQSETESVDSMLVEFTETQIEFTATEMVQAD
ncbi:MAG: type II/IV secretion system protein, partial [Planctomycetales bacterium]|nr:type II/IV secretion system protein [Planctomycetales bacterium]